MLRTMARAQQMLAAAAAVTTLNPQSVKSKHVFGNLISLWTKLYFSQECNRVRSLFINTLCSFKNGFPLIKTHEFGKREKIKKKPLIAGI